MCVNADLWGADVIDLAAIAEDIEKTRDQLHRLALKKELDFKDENVMLLSKKLDALITQYERNKLMQMKRGGADEF